MLLKLAQLLRENLHELALLESLDMGKLVNDAATVDVPGSAAIFQLHSFENDMDQILIGCSTRIAACDLAK